MEHRLQIYPRHFNSIAKNKKKFELRRFKGLELRVGDIITLLEFDGIEFTGRKIRVKITYILSEIKNYGLKENFFIFSFDVLK